MADIQNNNQRTPVMVMFGMSPERMNKVLEMLKALEPLEMHPALTEADGIAKIDSLPELDVVVIGAGFTGQPAENITAATVAKFPLAKVINPTLQQGMDQILETVKVELDKARKK